MWLSRSGGGSGESSGDGGGGAREQATGGLGLEGGGTRRQATGGLARREGASCVAAFAVGGEREELRRRTLGDGDGDERWL